MPQDENELLNLAIVSKFSNIPPSQCFNISDELTGFELNAACAFLLMEFENRREVKRLETQLKGIACLLGASPDSLNDSDDDDGDDEF